MASPPPDRLRQIISYKRDEVAALKRHRTMASLEDEAKGASPARGFADKLLGIARADGNALICEMKRKSPSAGAISLERDPVDVATAYEAGGAACISVLTDGPSFAGSLADMALVRNTVALPVLRKDFMIDPIQIAESRAAGADAILIIMAAVSDQLAKELHDAADRLGLSVLLEAHDRDELDRALKLPSPLVGVNNRNLKTMTTDLGTTELLAKYVPKDKLLITESGIREPSEVTRLRACGARGFLIGESLMKAENPRSAVAALVAAR
jgi:indole-3-glycerol phosphate synthase